MKRNAFSFTRFFAAVLFTAIGTFAMAQVQDHVTLSGTVSTSQTVSALKSITLTPEFQTAPGITFTARILADGVDTYSGSDTGNKNWVQSTAFDGTGAEIAKSKQYFDFLGKAVQQQSKNYTANKALVTETVRDALGREVLSTLPAAIDNPDLDYRPDFIANSRGEDYTYTDFDLSANVNNPERVNRAIPHTLGWYYSNNNTGEPYVPETFYPYSRVEYSKITGTVRRSSMAGEEMRMGQGHEPMSFALPVAEDELFAYYHAVNFPIAYKGLAKQVAVDPDGNYSVVYQNEEGRAIASTGSGGTKREITINILAALGYTDIHIPEGCENSLRLTSGITFQVTDLLTENVQSYIGTGGVVTIAPGFYRVSASLSNDAVIYASVNYAPPSLNIYDDAGRLVKTFSPQAVADNDPARCSTYEYNSLGWLIRTSSPDEGMSEYVYRKDGSIRFSQNAEQRVSGKFSYTNYDEAYRAIEVGEYTPGAGGITFSTTMDPEATLANGTFADQTFTSYDEPDATFSLDGYEQKFLTGAVSKTWTDQDATWYSYTYDGKVDWVVQDIDGLGPVTLDYAYDFNGNVTHVIYQKDVASEYFEHLYAYDADLRLSRVTTRECPTCTPEEQAQYEYYAHGPLKRVVLAENLQGIDYVYNINGWLKSMNHPDLVTTLDPGGDGAAGSTVEPDVFGMSLDYYSGDYQRENTSIPSHYGSNYNGNIAGIRWKTDAPAVPQLPVTGKHWVYKYGYDNRNWLTSADFGTHEALGDVMGGMPYKIYGVNYDFNGNLKTYYRYAQHNFIDLFTYNYISGTNKLDHLTDDVSSAYFPDDIDNQQPGNYTYNAIGQMTGNAQDGHFFTYNAYGKVSAIYSDAAHASLLAEYDYDDRGFRVRKRDYVNNKDTWYVRDVGGNILSIYEDQYDGNGITLTEVPLYGASRLGVNQKSDDKYLYELADHLGNVRATVYRDNATDNLAVETWADYYPFGMVLPGRSSSAGNYRFGYQGQFAEKDPETGYNQFEARLWDSRIGRWLVPDPAGQYYSPYLGMGNNPINGVDPDGEFDSRFDAWWYKIWTGGGNVSYAKDKGEWYVGNYVDYTGEGAGIAYKRTFEGNYVGPIAIGMSFEFALPRSGYFGGSEAVGTGISFGLVADYKGISPYFTKKELDLEARVNIATTFSVTLDATYYKPKVGNVFNENIAGDGFESGVGLGPGGIALGAALDPQGNKVATTITLSRGLKYKGEPLSIDAGAAVFKTKTYIPGRWNNNFSLTKF